MENISVNQLNINISNIIDIRDNDEHNKGHIPNSINIPYIKLIVSPEIYLNKKNTYYIYCLYGKKSINVCSYLTKMGYKVINITGGYEKWLLKK